MTRLTLTETLRESAERHRDRAAMMGHAGELLRGKKASGCNPTRCPKCRLLALADECDRHADITEREELAR